MAGFFVTGTDTGVGKTFISTALLHRARQEGWQSLGLKPVASGCEATPEGLRNSDAVLLRQHSSVSIDYCQTNPVALAPAIAPHVAALEQGVQLHAETLAHHCRRHLKGSARLVVVEGAGGWRVPLNATESFADIARLLQLPVILVVGMKLGCINHALLSAEAIHGDGLDLAGWVANHGPSTMERARESISTLADRLPAPCLAEVPWLGAIPDIPRAAGLLDINVLVLAAGEGSGSGLQGSAS